MASKFSDSLNPQKLLEKIKTVDGSGSGLDSDRVGGKGISFKNSDWSIVLRGSSFNPCEISPLEDGAGNSYLTAPKLAAMPVYSVGSYIFAIKETTGTLNPGGTIAGALIRPVSLSANVFNPGGVSNNSYGTGVSGTWRLMGYAYDDGHRLHNGSSLWLRIA